MPSHELDPRLPSERLIIVEQRILSIQENIEQKLTGMEGKLNEIHDQTKLTNGRVNALESWKLEFTSTRSGQNAVMKFIWTFISAVFATVLATILIVHFVNPQPTPQSTMQGMYPHFDKSGKHAANCTWNGEGQPNCIPLPAAIGNK